MDAGGNAWDEMGWEIHLCDHHMAVKGTAAMSNRRAVDMTADFGDDWGTEGHVGHEMAVHDVDLRT